MPLQIKVPIQVVDEHAVLLLCQVAKSPSACDIFRDLICRNLSVVEELQRIRMDAASTGRSPEIVQRSSGWRIPQADLARIRQKREPTGASYQKDLERSNFRIWRIKDENQSSVGGSVSI